MWCRSWDPSAAPGASHATDMIKPTCVANTCVDIVQRHKCPVYVQVKLADYLQEPCDHSGLTIISNFVKCHFMLPCFQFAFHT